MSRRAVSLVTVIAFLLFGFGPLSRAVGVTAANSGEDVTYTSSADFAKGTLVNVNTDDVPNALSLNKVTSTFPFIWVALSDRETIAKIDTATGAILGEYRGMSEGAGSYATSRTTVMLDGSVWFGHRFTSVVTHVGLPEANQCVDRNGNGVIDTSTGYGNVLAWPGGTSGHPSAVSNAADECILATVDTPGGDSRHMSVDKDGNIWVGDFGSRGFVKLDGRTGAFLLGDASTAYKYFPCGGYGGFIDRNGVIWSANGGSNLLRWDPNDAADNGRCLNRSIYGLALDPDGNVWGSELGAGRVHKFQPDGTEFAGSPFSTGISGSQGLAADANGDIWLSSSLYCDANCSVPHLAKDGTLIGLVPMPANGAGATGVAVDAAGKIWTANINSSTATRIDPAAGADSSTVPGRKVGAVDLTVDLPATAADAAAGTIALPAARPYNYSDMTGAVALGSTSPQGSWTIVQDSGQADFRWHTISFDNEPEASIPPGSSVSLSVEARAADTEAGLGAKDYRVIDNCVVIQGLSGRFIQVRVTLRAASNGSTPVVSDVVIRGGNGVKEGECVKTTPTTAVVLDETIKRGKPQGYAFVTGDGGIHPRGELTFVGTAKAPSVVAPSGLVLNDPIVAAAVTPSGHGYYLVGSDGGVFTVGDAVFHGSAAGMVLNQPIVGIALDPDGAGYWLVARDGGVFGFDAAFAGSAGAMTLNQPVVGMAADPDGTGYWLVARDGGVFSFDAPFAGSTGAMTLNQPIVGMAAGIDGKGYWLVAGDGGVFAFDEPFAGSAAGGPLNAPVRSIAADPDGGGYWLGAADGGVFSFDAPFLGSIADTTLYQPVIGAVAP